MKRNPFIRLLAVPLCAAMLAGALALPVSAAVAPKPPFLTQVLYDVADAALNALLRGLSMLYPTDLPRQYTTGPDFFPGMDTFLDAPAGGAKWSLGYARASLIPPGLFDPETGAYIGPDDIFVGGELVGEGQRALIDRKTPTRLLDDMCVRVTAISDGSGNGPKGHKGRGTVVFASLDAYALTLYDVRVIRGMLLDFAEQNNIVGINIGVLHQHSCIDTLGMNGMILGALFVNPWNARFGWFSHHGKNARFMENLHTTTADAIKAAVAAMEPGTLYYGSADAADYLRDKRPPTVLDTRLHRLRFVPDNKTSRETWLLNYASHASTLGPTREVTSDYPHYAEEQVNRLAGANVQMILGANLAIGRNDRPFEAEGVQYTDRERMVLYGRAVGDLAVGINNDEAVEPMLNIKMAEYRMPVDNPIHLAMFRTGMLEAVGVRRCDLSPDIDIITEIGYMELGDGLAVILAPGEIDPVLVQGGALPASEAYTGRDFLFTPMRDMVRGGRRLLTFGVMNDHSGYYLVPNDIQNFILFGTQEINAASKQAAESLLEAFEGLTASVIGK